MLLIDESGWRSSKLELPGYLLWIPEVLNDRASAVVRYKGKPEPWGRDVPCTLSNYKYTRQAAQPRRAPTCLGMEYLSCHYGYPFRHSGQAGQGAKGLVGFKLRWRHRTLKILTDAAMTQM